jgi:hypothetical protein
MILKARKTDITGASGNVEGGTINRDYTSRVNATGDNLTHRWQVSTDGGETWTETWLTGYNTECLYFTLNALRASKLYKCVITDRYGDVVETNVVSATIG